MAPCFVFLEGEDDSEEVQVRRQTFGLPHSTEKTQVVLNPAALRSDQTVSWPKVQKKSRASCGLFQKDPVVHSQKV